jgi:glucosamine 6-phosphate synthetase-like amidotransferase/phosphosugar isomerase protein
VCNINVFIKTKQNKVNNKTLLHLITTATGYSYMTNPDAEGVYFNRTRRLIKKSSKINYIELSEQIAQNDAIIAHQRISTSGFAGINNQPFKFKDFVLVHNGVVSSYAKNKRSDTYNIGVALQKLINEKSKDRTELYTNAIKTVFDKLSGSYSILIYDLKTDDIYYFKNQSTTIKVVRVDGLIHISTTDFSNIYSDYNAKVIPILDNSIYKINIMRGDFIEVATIEKETLPIIKSYPSAYSYGGCNEWCQYCRKWYYTGEMIPYDGYLNRRCVYCDTNKTTELNSSPNNKKTLRSNEWF